MKNLFYFFFFLLSTSALLFSCKKGRDNEKGAIGYIYTSTNSSSGNHIIALERRIDGSLEEAKYSPYSTGATGDAGEGDFDEQWSLRIVGDYLLAVNAGNNPVNGSISVFKINKENGKLTQVDQNPSTPQMDNMDSRGVRPTTIAVNTSSDKTWIVVGNQFANPNYQGDPPVKFGDVMNSDLRNLAVFTFNKSSGQLEFKKIGAVYNDGTYGGPTTALFNDAGTKLAVSTWGVAAFLTPSPNVSLQKPGRLYVYDFSNGELTQTGLFQEEGISGNIGLSWSPNQKYIYMANFNITLAKGDNSVTVHDGNTAEKLQNFATGSTTDNDEACWTHITPDNKRLYVSSFTGNIVSLFNIGSDDKLSVSLTPNFVKRRNVPMPDTKDIYEGSGGFLYVNGAFQSHSVTVFKMQGDGSLIEQPGSPYHIPSSAGKTSMEQSFIGLIGFDKSLDNYKSPASE
ncbi:MAG: hypothetical protein M3015_06820 [Bacteroidota bacterium]|nr:hypothetical protein [Bacteroidota bacterium]